jgi:hypothetical protein
MYTFALVGNKKDLSTKGKTGKSFRRWIDTGYNSRIDDVFIACGFSILLHRHLFIAL